MYNVLDHGIKKDGTTDNTQAIADRENGASGRRNAVLPRRKICDRLH